MLDRKFIVENAEAVKQNCVNRGVEAEVDRLVELEAKRRELLKEVCKVKCSLYIQRF